jgi:hypothetical protein
MKFTLKLTNNSRYSEVGQRNPLRWKTLLLNKDGSYTDQSGWIKCKDFFNDTVAFFKVGSVFSIYGYENNIKKNADGVYFLLKYIDNYERFNANMAVVNKQLQADLGCEMKHWPSDTRADEVILLMPNELWETTYRISMACMVVRLCNYTVDYKTWGDLWKEGNPARTEEHAFTPEAFKNAQKWGFLVPEKFRKYWYYCGPEYNSEKNPKQTGGTIHNNGVSSWSMYMQQQGA